MKRIIIFLTAGVLVATTASAAQKIDTVYVGDVGNANDSTGYGGVSYGYHIGTTEVTNAQYASFLNATAASDPNGLWNSSMGSDARGGISRSGNDGSYTYSTKANMANKPVNFVSFWDAARFTNWLTSGNTESGVYMLTSAGIGNNTITRNTVAWNAGGVAVASGDEWYKAAYYDPTLSSGSGGYWSYATQSPTLPTEATATTTGDIANPGINVANYGYGADWNSQSGNVTTVGSAGADSSSFYGTFDQVGNVGEWNDERIFNLTTGRGIWGGAYTSNDFELTSDNFPSFSPTFEFPNAGFRISSLAAIPEPSSYAALAGLIGLLLALRLRRVTNFKS